MDELAEVLREMNERLADIASTLSDISQKLDSVGGDTTQLQATYDITAAVEAASDHIASNITDALGQSLGDIHSKLEDIHSQLIMDSMDS